MKINTQLIRGVYYLTATLPTGRFRYSTGITEPKTKAERKESTYRLTTMQHEASVLMRRLENENRLTPTELKHELNSYRGKKKPVNIDLVSFATGWIKTYSKTHGANTVKSFDALLFHLKQLDPIPVAEVSDEYFDQLFLHFTESDYAKNFIAKMMSNFRRLLREAKDRGLWQGTESRYRCSQELVYNIYLTTGELDLIRVRPFDEYLSNARDLFLIGCYTGLRFSDLMRFVDAGECGDVITLTQHKTGGRVIIPVHPVVRECMQRHPHSISNQKLNDYLKLIGKGCDINTPVSRTRTQGNKRITTRYMKWELMATHTMRRTAITNMWKAGIQVQSIMMISGHTTERQFMAYLKTTEEDNAEILKNHQFFNPGA